MRNFAYHLQWTFFFGFLFLANVGYSQYTAGESIGYGNAGLSGDNAWSIAYNPAGIALSETMEAGVFYNTRFQTKEMATKGLVFTNPLQGGTIGLWFSSYGYSQFSQNRLGIAYARKLSEKLSAGIRMQYLSLRIGEGYGTSKTVTASAGFQYQLNKEILLSGYIFNPNKSKFTDYNNEKIPALMKGGIKYAFSDKVFITSEVWASSIDKTNVVVGAEYKIHDKVVLRGGIATQPASSSFGFGLKLNQFDLNFSSAYHTHLGFSPAISLLYHGK